jgi:hypothetical protein
MKLLVVGILTPAILERRKGEDKVFVRSEALGHRPYQRDERSEEILLRGRTS